MKRLAIIGGGISGLAAAWAARAAPQPSDGLEIIVLEQGSAPGGVAQSIGRDGWLVESGPNGFLSGSPAIERLIDAVGLRDTLLAASAVAARRYIYWHGRMRRVTPSPIGLVRSGLLSPAGAARLLAEVGVPRRENPDDESIEQFVARRFGREAAERLARPMTLGVFAGDTRALSVAAAFPSLAELERSHRSVIRGFFARQGTPRGALTSFAGGIGALAQALAARGAFTVRCGARVTRVTSAGVRWRIDLDGGNAVDADALAIAAGPRPASDLFRSINTIVADNLAAIATPPVSVVALGYDPRAASRVPAGFGVLMARDAGFRMLGNLWESQIFPDRAPAGHVLIRALYGGSVDPEAALLGRGELAALARSEISRLYGIVEEPVFEELVQWSDAIPQYAVGHGERVDRIEGAMASIPGCALAGTALNGVSFPAAAAAGIAAGERAAAWLVRQTGTAVPFQ
ncbi:MAG TPA: protoporphyrinogen oxidase [Gemmatimonadales bacterium]